jgi:hypothetical protein
MKHIQPVSIAQVSTPQSEVNLYELLDRVFGFVLELANVKGKGAG